MIILIINEITQKLENKNYNKVTVNVDGIYLYYTVILRHAYIILLTNFITGDEFTKEQYDHITLQIKNNFKEKNFEEIHVLCLLFTEDVEKVKYLCIDKGNHWIIDTKSRKLIIFENQSATFLDTRELIESVLATGYHMNSNNSNTYGTYTSQTNTNQWNNYETGDYTHRRTMVRRHYFTICNSLIIIVNIIIFLILEKNGSTMDTEYMLKKGAMYWPYIISYKEYYRLFTYMFLHYGFSHIANNMIVLAFIGDNLERAAGKLRYLFIYLSTGIIAGLASMGYNMLHDNNVVGVGASGAIFGVVGAMLYIVIVNRGQLEDISMRQLVLFAILSIYSGFTSQGTDNIAHVAGFISGILIAALTYRKPKKREVY